MFKQLISRANFTFKFLTVVRDITRLDAVLEAIDDLALSDRDRLRRIIDANPLAQAFRARPVPPPVLDKAALHQYPKGSLGKAFAEFLDEKGIDPADLVFVPFGDPSIDSFREHARKTHDLWHALTGFDTDPAGELGLQGVYMAQQPSPVTGMLIALIFLNGFVKSPEDMSRRVTALTRGWLLGKRARPLFGTNWNELFARPLAEVRRQFNIEITAVDEILARGVPAEGTPERAATVN
jgi:ubiquinone biosynthesis protein COQ4